MHHSESVIYFISKGKLFTSVSLPEPPLSKWFLQTEITGERLNKNFPCLSPSERHMDLQAQTLNKYIKYQNTVYKLFSFFFFFPPLGRNQHQNRRIMSVLGCEATQSLPDTAYKNQILKLLAGVIE